MKTALLIINYNDALTTQTLINNVSDYNCLDRIVVLDNMSTDNSYSFLYEKYNSDHINIIQSEGNKGYAYAINYGCKFLMDIYGDCNVIVSNSDIIIYNEEDIKKLIESKEDSYAIVAPITREKEGLDRGWKIPYPIQDSLLNLVYIHRFLKPKLLFYSDEYYKDKKMVEVDVVLGCFYLIDTRYLRQVNFYDENTFLYYEENIMARKLKNINAKSMINCEVEVYHNHSVSIDRSVKKLKKFQLLKESQYYFQVNYNNANLFERFLLKFTYKLSYYIFKIAYKFQ